ncbi:MAG TPA: sigma-70 family RNA polymerase sigma factor [Ktedonobacteraceae bacterium]
MQYILTEVSDKTLVEQSLAGNQDAFESLVRRYSVTLFDFISGYLGDYDLACDVLQHVLLQLYLCLPKLLVNMSGLDRHETLKSWLFRVAWNRCADERRRKRLLLFSELDVAGNEDLRLQVNAAPDNCPLPEEIAEQRDLQRMLQKAIELLPSKYRPVVYLRYIKEMTFEAIGHHLHMPESTAKTYFQRARPLLRASLNL